MKAELTINALAEPSSAYSVHGLVNQLFDTADVRINGNRPWDIQVHNSRLIDRIVAQGSLGIGESYMEGWWDCGDLDEAFFRIMRVEHEGRFKVSIPFILPLFILALKSKVMNHQSKSRAFTVAEKHYDIGNDLYRCMLDKRMIYTEAYLGAC
jgi:cyclopropane-fatty-acyl-phospholipid synthase